MDQLWTSNGKYESTPQSATSQATPRYLDGVLPVIGRVGDGVGSGQPVQAPVEEAERPLVLLGVGHQARDERRGQAGAADGLLNCLGRVRRT